MGVWCHRLMYQALMWKRVNQMHVKPKMDPKMPICLSPFILAGGAGVGSPGDPHASRSFLQTVLAEDILIVTLFPKDLLSQVLGSQKTAW